jgi:hypothetical protein
MSKAERKRQNRFLEKQQKNPKPQKKKNTLIQTAVRNNVLGSQTVNTSYTQTNRMTKEEAQKSWADLADSYLYNSIFARELGLFSDKVSKSTSADHPEDLLNRARNRVQETWIKDTQDSTKPVSDGGQMTRAEQTARLEESYFGIPNPYGPKDYMYRFTDGEVDVVSGGNWLLAAAHEMETLFNKD